jgi:S1-C subfamily serine protease
MAALLLWLLLPAPVSAQGGHEVVQCLDEAVGTVQKTLASDCRGRVVAEDEAAVLRNHRRDYIQKVLSRAPDPKLQGKKLARVGSGFFIAEDGSVLTSHHIVEGCSGISVAPTFGELRLVTGVVPDEEADLALLRTDAAPPAIAVFAQDSGPAIVASAFVSGYPEQGMVTMSPVLTAVEVLRREADTPHGPAMIVRGDIRKGNSGGPLLDTGGNVIGVVVAKIDSVALYKATGETVVDVGLILPGDRVQRFLEAQSVEYRHDQRQPLQPPDRILEDTRPFMVQVGCWK